MMTFGAVAKFQWEGGADEKESERQLSAAGYSAFSTMARLGLLSDRKSASSSV
jgi:hypothetical protein